MNVRERVQKSSPEETQPPVTFEPPSPLNPYEGFDGARSALAGLFLTATQGLKPGMNQLLHWMAEQEDGRWDEVYGALHKASGHFNDLYAALGAALGYLNPRDIERER